MLSLWRESSTREGSTMLMKTRQSRVRSFTCFMDLLNYRMFWHGYSMDIVMTSWPAKSSAWLMGTWDPTLLPHCRDHEGSVLHPEVTHSSLLLLNPSLLMEFHPHRFSLPSAPAALLLCLGMFFFHFRAWVLLSFFNVWIYSFHLIWNILFQYIFRLI